MELTRHEARAVRSVIAVINANLDTDAVWCFGASTKSDKNAGDMFARQGREISMHLYLLAFVKECSPDATKYIAEYIKKQVWDSVKVTVTLLFYQTANLPRVKGNHRCFLADVVSKGGKVYQRDGFAIPDFSNAAVDVKARLDYFSHCKYMAACCLEGEAAIENPNAEPMQAILLGQTVEQLCLGLIYAFLGCRPNYFAPGYLLELCLLFMPEIEELFPRGSAEEQARFAVLSLRMETLRYRAAHPSITNIEVLRSRVHKFKKLAEAAVENHLLPDLSQIGERKALP